MEEVEVVRWECDQCGAVRSNDPHSNLCLCFATGNDTANWTWTKLTGTRKRPIPQKTERCESVEGVQINDIGVPRYNSSPLVQFPGAKGKTVTLTAVWEE